MPVTLILGECHIFGPCLCHATIAVMQRVHETCSRCQLIVKTLKPYMSSHHARSLSFSLRVPVEHHSAMLREFISGEHYFMTNFSRNSIPDVDVNFIFLNPEIPALYGHAWNPNSRRIPYLWILTLQCNNPCERIATSA